MRRTAGVAFLLVAAALLLLGALLLYLAYVRPAPYAIGALLFALAAIVLGVYALRSAGRRLALTRPALFAAVVGAGTIVLAAIIVPSMLMSRDRQRQLGTMSDLRKIAAALEEHASATKSYPDARAIGELESHLTPAYIRELPQRDRWGHLLRYERLSDGYAIASPGKDGLWQRPHLRDYPHAATTGLDADIVFANGGFTQFPDSGPHPY